MADQLATPSDLAAALQQNVDTATATLWTECATAVVQAAAGGQRIVQVVADTATITGSTSSWLDLPQIPVTAVISVTLDGGVLTVGAAGSGCSTYRVHGNRLWRADGWQTYNAVNPVWNVNPRWSTWPAAGEPSQVVVVNTHGYPPGAQELQLGRSAVLGMSKAVYTNIGGVSSEKIDDYSVVYAEMQAYMDANDNLRNALYRQYGRRSGLVSLR